MLFVLLVESVCVTSAEILMLSRAVCIMDTNYAPRSSSPSGDFYYAAPPLLTTPPGRSIDINGKFVPQDVSERILR